MFVDTMQKETTRVMSLIKLALLLASEALPSTKFPALCSLLWHLNILDASGQGYSLGNRYTHRNAAKDFVAARASVLRDRINVAARASRVLGLMLEESTDQSGKKVLLLYLRFCEKGRFVTRFLAALEVVDASAVGLFHLITKHFDAMEVPFSKLFTYASVLWRLPTLR
jgi:hypothetical protein